ncbi:MAG: extracellular solute-binding protein, partial [Hungatella sp.]
MKKRIFAVLLAASMMASLTACGGKEVTTESTTATNNQTTETEAKKTTLDPATMTEVVFWHNRGGKAGELLEQTMIPKFNETKGKELGITVVPVYQSSTDLIAKLKALILAKDVTNLPDLVQVFAGDAEYMSTVPYVIPAQTLIAQDDTFHTDELFPQLLETYTYAGTLYSLPFHASTMIMYYNKTAFKEAGLDPEKAPETIADVADAASKLLKKDASGVKQYAITMGIQNTYLNHFIGGQG